MQPSQIDNDHQCTIAMLMLPGFNSLAANSFIDPFRVANYLHGENSYHWQYLSLDGDLVTASNAMSLTDTETYDDNSTHFDFVIVNASWTPERFGQRKLVNWLKRQASQGATMVGLDTGSYVLAQAGLLNGYRCTIHYEHFAAFREVFPQIDLHQSLFVIDRERLSCCGGVACTDLALEIIHLQQGLNLTNATAHYIFHERLRPGEEQQMSGSHEPVGYTVKEQVRETIVLMERNLEEPLTLTEITQYVGISPRHLQRLFHYYTGKTPVQYYLDLRLDRARGLVTQTENSLVEIGGSCGFSRSETFSRAYRKRFGITPSKDRIEGRVPFQFRSFPGYAGI